LASPQHAGAEQWGERIDQGKTSRPASNAGSVMQHQKQCGSTGSQEDFAVKSDAFMVDY
jgi:hypothetical protein